MISGQQQATIIWEWLLPVMILHKPVLPFLPTCVFKSCFEFIAQSHLTLRKTWRKHRRDWNTGSNPIAPPYWARTFRPLPRLRSLGKSELYIDCQSAGPKNRRTNSSLRWLGYREATTCLDTPEVKDISLCSREVSEGCGQHGPPTEWDLEPPMGPGGPVPEDDHIVGTKEWRPRHATHECEDARRP